MHKCKKDVDTSMVVVLILLKNPPQEQFLRATLPYMSNPNDIEQTEFTSLSE